ncbi:hypothetical protein NFHkm12_15800 [Latilactobacillus curvatus]|uniref:SLATT domain-containing protein n=1 Tax=Latilactobacillus curvatus TaxID=28038 RepID=UPI000DBBA180|nr:SLATT domain-containing protein [Latilactobacillus curvatus]WBY48591.1 SLATT domain-containing protein [Latilactobacillus curvatus]BBE26754.1 hypothetical protein NFHkm12_15800 [Latilactobacillus curvatus]
MVDQDIYRDMLKKQITDAFGKVVYTYTSHLKNMNILLEKQAHLKNTQLIISAIASGGIISAIFLDHFWLKLMSALISTCSTAINLYLKSSDFQEDASQHRAASDELWLVREDYLSLLTDFDTLPIKDIKEQRERLKQAVYEIDSTFPKTNSKSYSLAQQALKNDEEQFFSNKELNFLLPEHLRNK